MIHQQWNYYKMETRSIYELLIILRDNAKVTKSYFGLKQRIISGLCNEMLNMSTTGITNKYNISHKEYSIFFLYIQINRPKWNMGNAYGWKPTLWRPRLKWLNEHIKLNKPKMKESKYKDVATCFLNKILNDKDMPKWYTIKLNKKEVLYIPVKDINGILC